MDQENDIPKGEIISTAFPYVYSIPHLGNIVQALKGDIYNKLKNCVFEHQGLSVKSYFCYGFHATGTPVYHRLNRLKLIIKQYYPFKNQNNKKALARALVTYFKEENIMFLAPHIKGIRELLHLKGWINILARYYTNLFAQLGIKTNLPDYHTTTKVDAAYSKFVNHLYNKLDQQKKLILKNNYLIACNKCDNVLGDHDRTSYEGVGVSNIKVFACNLNGQIWLSLSSSEHISGKNNWFKSGLFVIDAALKDWLFKKTIKKEDLILYLPSLKVDQVFSFSFSPSQDTPPMLEEVDLYTTISKIKCRCGGYAKIRTELTYFVNFEDSYWKNQALIRIHASNLSDSDKKTLVSTLDKLKDVAFLRTKGYGTTLDLLKSTDYKDKFVDSLMDSALHPYFYASYLNKDLNFQDVLNSYNYTIHCAGADLLQNHLLYMYLFSTLLYPDIKVPFFDTTRFILARNKEKMSKSLKNVIYWDDIKDKIDPISLKSYVYSLADSNNASTYDQKEVLAIGRATKKHIRKILTFLEQGRCNESSLNQIKSDILNPVIELLSFKKGSPKIRFLYHKLIFELSNILSKAKPGDKDKRYTKFLCNLVSSFC